MFRFFRRYQKTLIVVGGVILMFVFTLSDPLMSWMRTNESVSGGRDPNATAVTWDGGKLTVRELDSLAERRQLVNRFVMMVERMGYDRAEAAGREAIAPRVARVGDIGRDWTRQRLDMEVLLTHVLAQRGKELGIEISDAAVLAYIENLGRGELRSDDIFAILSAINLSGRTPSVDLIYSALKEELLASAVQRTYGAGLSASDMFAAELPVNRWEDWKRVNDRVVLEAAAINPATSLIDVDEPTDEELREYYDKYKDRAGYPVTVAGVELPSPVPGFKTPRKVKLQYLRANYQEFVDRYSKEVTDEEIAEYYEEHKYEFEEVESFDELFGAPGVDETSTEEMTGDADDAATDKDSTAEQGSSEEPGEGTNSDASNSKEMEADESDEGQSNEEASDEPIESKEKPSESVDATTEGDQGNASGEALTESTGESSAARRANPFRLVAYQEEASDKDDSGDETTSDESTESAADGETTVGDSEAELKEPANGDSAELMEEEIKYQPLEEVADDIRRKIAEDRFFSEIDSTMQSIVGRLNPAFDQYVGAKLDADAVGKPEPKPPEQLLNLQPIADEYGLELEETVDLDIFELRDSLVGKSVGLGKYNGVRVFQLMFAPDGDKYRPILSADFGQFGDRYLVMKIADTPERVPDFKEVKQEVAKAWRMEKAAELALEKAKETAKKAQDSGLSLKDFFVDKPEIEITMTPTFTQLTQGDIAPASFTPEYRLSQPSGVENVGPAFLEEVFKLKQDEVTALPNFDKSIVYIVRMADEYESVQQLRSDFLEQANYWPGRGAFFRATAQAARGAAMAAMLENINVEWSDTEDDAAEDNASEG